MNGMSFVNCEFVSQNYRVNICSYVYYKPIALAWNGDNDLVVFVVGQWLGCGCICEMATMTLLSLLWDNDFVVGVFVKWRQWLCCGCICCVGVLFSSFFAFGMLLLLECLWEIVALPGWMSELVRK